MTESQKLLADFVASQSESAFRELVMRYIDLVYTAASRLTDGDKHLAEDVAQTVFVDIARMAGRLPRNIMLGGWLHRHTCYVTATVMRSERRRQAREKKAMEMNLVQDHTEANLAQVAPILDEAVNQLGAEDRAAILLRFFDQSDFRSIGEALETSEDAARKRVARALEKLHVLLKQRGVAFSTGALTMSLATGAVTAAPAGLASQITSAVLSSFAAGTVTTMNFFKIITAAKVKTGIFAAIVIAGIVTPLLIEQQSRRELREENTVLRQQLEQMAKSSDENKRLLGLAAQTANSPSRGDENNFNELLRLRGQIGLLQRELFDQTNASRKIKVAEQAQETDSSPEPLYSRTFRVDPKTFRESLQAVSASANPASTTASSFGPFDGTESEVIRTAATQRNLQTDVRNFFITAGVAFPTNAPTRRGFGIASGEPTPPQKTLFFNERTGVLLVRASMPDLDIIEEAIHALNTAPDQVAAEPK